jgi:hypothetical protein
MAGFSRRSTNSIGYDMTSLLEALEQHEREVVRTPFSLQIDFTESLTVKLNGYFSKSSVSLFAEYNPMHVIASAFHSKTADFEALDTLVGMIERKLYFHCKYKSYDYLFYDDRGVESQETKDTLIHYIENNSSDYLKFQKKHDKSRLIPMIRHEVSIVGNVAEIQYIYIGSVKFLGDEPKIKKEEKAYKHCIEKLGEGEFRFFRSK